MTRQTKILFVMGCVVAGVVAMMFLSSGEPARMSVSFAGASSNGPGFASFTVTNHGQKSVTFSMFGQESSNGLWQARMIYFQRPDAILPAHASMQLTFHQWTTNHWRFAPVYYDSPSFPVADKLRHEASRRAWVHHWPSLSQRLMPKVEFRRAYSPTMLGIQPVEAGLK